MSEYPHHLLQLNIRTLTPLHIGDDKGKTLSPYADYVFSPDGRYLHYLNLKKIEQAVMRAGALEEYVGLIQSMDNNRSDLDLRRFLTERLKCPLDEVTAIRVPCKGLKADRKIPIIPIVKNAGNPYLPGSSLKGALRTAILYDWLVCTKAGEPEIKAFYQELSTSKPSKKDVINAERLFGRLNDKERPPYTQFIRVRDSEPLPTEDLCVYSLRRIRIVPGGKKTKGGDIPQVVEAIRPGVNLRTEISILPKFDNTVLNYWKTGKFEEIFPNIAGFSLDCIKNEIAELQDAYEKQDSKEVEALLEFYEDLKAQAEKGAVLLRLGFGKTINDNSLLLAFLNGLDEKAWKKAQKVVSSNKAGEFYPVTRAITPEGRPMGWVEITPANTSGGR
jgi:CRISPR-associated protein Csm5